MIYGLAYFVVALLLARFLVPRISEGRDDAEWGAAMMLVWPVALPVALLLAVGKRGWERR